MDRPKKKSKELIPKRIQIVLLVVGLPLLAFTAVRFSSQMGWIGGPPKAKPVVKKKEDRPKPGGDTGAPKTDTRVARAPTPGRGPRPTLPELDSVTLPDRDPLADLGLQAPPTEAAAPGQPGAPAPPPSQPPGAPPLPPPLPVPAAAPGFPSPVTGQAAALPREMLPAVPREPGLPAALAASYPVARRGGRAPRTASVALVGTISGPEGSLAVVRPADGAGGPGRYVRPGQKVDGRSGDEVKSIGPGKLTLKSRGRTHELSLPSPESGSTGSEARPEGSTRPSAPME